ncbi:MAG: F0F1 ATP synthase subunit epsilon [Microbacteriaceae bacterium]|nr:F0F1 ATP synthase subunit epsilon [Microbacteriaceae bacterium]
MAASFDVEIVSADRIVWTGQAQQVIARTQIGEIGVLAGHEPVLALLAPGPVRITTPESRLVTVSAADGFLSVEGDAVRVIAREAAVQETDSAED